MKRLGRTASATALAVLLLATACEQKTWTHDEITDIAADAADEGLAEELAGRVDDLSQRVAVLEDRLRIEEARSAAVADQADRVASQVATNAAVSNANALKDATERGACGTELVQDAPGVWRNRKIPCTAEVYWGKR